MDIFDPVDYSVQENAFLLDNVGKPPVVALAAVPQNVNPKAVRPILDRIYELVEVEKHSGTPWCGTEAVREKIQAYLNRSDRWAADSKRAKGAPRFPSMHSFDSRKRAHRSGPGSDSGKVRTYFDAKGERVPFAVELVSQGDVEWNPEWVKADQPASGAGITVNQEKNRIECFCGHTESFNPESRGSFNAARARTSKHLRSAKVEVEKHREVHTSEFGG